MIKSCTQKIICNQLKIKTVTKEKNFTSNPYGITQFLGVLSMCRGKFSDKKIKVNKNAEKHILGCFTISPLSQPLLDCKTKEDEFYRAGGMHNEVDKCMKLQVPMLLP